VLGPGVTGQRAALTRLQHALASQPGVAGVVGPADIPAVQRGAHLMLARSGNAARYGAIERSDPLGATAISRVRELRRELPAMARTAGLTGMRVEVAGETALAGEAIDSAVSDLGRIALVIGVVIAILLACFLRALVAPLYLLGASVLALLSALGLTVWIFQNALGYDSLVYYVPFVAAVLLISLGSDYNVFVVGRIWEEARRRPLREAVAVAVAAPRASRAITTAGLALAAGFGVLALVPLDQFRELAVAMVLGIVIDTFVVRSLLVPALVVLFGRVGSWPARLFSREPAPARQPDRTAVRSGGAGISRP
jgi:RND superfamily putative drug exporter